MNLPTSQKWVDKKVPLWFIFGERLDGTVDVSDTSGDVFDGVPREVADKLIAARDRHLDELYSILCKEQ